jgi:hypothetical protein
MLMVVNIFAESFPDLRRSAELRRPNHLETGEITSFYSKKQTLVRSHLFILKKNLREITSVVLKISLSEASLYDKDLRLCPIDLETFVKSGDFCYHSLYIDL